MKRVIHSRVISLFQSSCWKRFVNNSEKITLKRFYSYSMMKKLFLLAVLCLPMVNTINAQDQKLVDSLSKALRTEKADTSRVLVLYELSKAYWYNNYDEALKYATQIEDISGRLNYKKGIAYALLCRAAVHFNKSEFQESLELDRRALDLLTGVNDKLGMAFSNLYIGSTFINMGNFAEAIKYQLIGLKISEEIGDKSAIGDAQNNIGVIYYNQNEFVQALRYYNASLKARIEIGDKNGIGSAYNNIGNVQVRLGNLQEALRNQFAAVKINEDIGNWNWKAYNLGNIGNIYLDLGNDQQALKYTFEAIKILEKIGDKSPLATDLSNIGAIYTRQHNYENARQYLDKALSLSKEIGNLENLKSAYENITNLDSAQGNYKQAFKDYKLTMAYRDSMLNSESTKKTMRQQMQYDFDKKESVTKAEQDRKNIIAQKELQRQKFMRNGFVGGFTVVLLFAGVFLRQRNKIGKEKQKSDAEKKRSDELLLNILPGEVAEELKSTGAAKAKSFTMVTVMLTDFKDFTKVSERVSAELLVDEIHACFSAFDLILQKHKIEKIKTIGDAYLCASGLPVPSESHATDMVETAIEIRDYMLQRKIEKEARGEIPFEIRIGLHTGPVVAGIVGIKKYAYDIWGDTVNLAARMEQNSEAGKINISGSTYDLVKSKFSCTHRGKIQAKNKGELDMYFVT